MISKLFCYPSSLPGFPWFLNDRANAALALIGVLPLYWFFVAIMIYAQIMVSHWKCRLAALKLQIFFFF